MAQYAEGCYWEDSCKLLHNETNCESEFFNNEHISSNELHEDERLRIGWLTDRVCEIRYIGENKFQAERCENSKLQVGDTFTCLNFKLNQPLTMVDLRRDGIIIEGTYVVGQKNGLTTLMKIQD